MKMEKSSMGLRKGDIVWARVVYPKKWWPGLILSIDVFGVAVSFFDGGANPRYFLETEVCSFQENFESLIGTVKNCSKGEELVDAALKLMSKRVTSSLKCPCHYRPPLQSDAISRRSKRSRRRDFFRPDAVLAFAIGLAVSPFVSISDFIYAVNASAQLNAFRNYVVSKQKLFRQPEATRDHHERDAFSCLSPPLALGACSGVQKSDAFELEFEPSSDDQPNSGSWIQTEQTQLQSLHELLLKLHSLALDTNYMRGEFLNAVKQKILTIRYCAYQTILNTGTEKCSCRSNAVQFSRTCYKKSLKVVENDCRDISTPHKSNFPCPISFLGLKRNYNYPVDSDFCFKFCKTTTLFSINAADADIQKRNAGPNECMFGALISQPALANLYLKCCNTMPFSFSNGTDAQLQINRSRCKASTSGAFFSGSQVGVLTVDARSRTTNYLPSPCAANQTQMEPCNSGDATSVATNRQESTDAAFRDSSMDGDNETVVEINKQVRTDAAFRDSSIYGDVGSSVETNKQVSNVAFKDSYMDVDDDTLMETNRQVCADATFRDSSVDNKKLHLLFTCHVPLKPQAAQQSPYDTIAHSRSLCMKFPKNFILPLKKDLIRKFSIFGEVDSFRTKIYTRTGAALVVFLHQLDAVAAYQYAKRKRNIFGEPNILFWLDYPCEKKRRRTKFIVPLPNLKSCLKKSDLHGREDKKCTKKVRFLMET